MIFYIKESDLDLLVYNTVCKLADSVGKDFLGNKAFLALLYTEPSRDD